VEEKEETIIAEEIVSVGHTINTLSCIYAIEKKIVEKLALSEDPNQKKNGRYNLRSQGPVSELE